MRITLTILLVLNLCGCGDIYRHLKSGDVGWAIKKELRDEKSQSIEIAKLTKFQWDELFLFGPYQPTNEICKRLDLSSIECKSLIDAESIGEGETLMVFRNKGKIVHSEIHFRFQGDFAPVPDKPLTPRTAIFTVSIEGKDAQGEDWVKLHPIAMD